MVFICVLSLLHYVSFYTYMTPLQTKYCNKTTTKTKVSLGNSWQKLLGYSCEKTVSVFFWAWLYFSPYFQLYMKEKSLPSNLFLRNYHVHQRIPVKSTLLLRKNITCVNGILFRETTLLSLSLNFLGSINDYSIKNYKSNFINNFKKKLYQINKM